jgi:hypothetical protein
MPELPKEPETSAGKERANHLEEWKKARDTLQFFDDKLHDLRKYGFSFLTGLLAAGSILSEIVLQATLPSTITPERVKFAVFFVTLMLIVALHLLDKNYRVLQQAACTRAIVLERKLNLEFSETMAVRHKHGKIDQHLWYVYKIFILGVAGLGIAILYPHWLLMVFLAICALAAWLFMRRQRKELQLEFRNPGMCEDWTVSPLECTRDEEIKITLNNLNEEPDSAIIFEKYYLIWEIKNKYEDIEYQVTPLQNLKVYGNHSWVVKPSAFENGGKKGVYRLQPRGWKTPLPISIIVHK